MNHNHQREKVPGAKARGNQMQTSISPLSARIQGLQLPSLATTRDNTYEVLSAKKAY